MKILLIISVVVILIVVLVVKNLKFGDQLAQDPSRPPGAMIPNQENANDKIILVSNVSHEDIRKALTGFCNIYNKDRYDALPRLWQISTNSFAVTFAYDIDFATYCFAVNFLKYPIDIKWNADVHAWVTTKAADDWVTDKTLNKKVMLYLADNDKEYDNVFLTTQDNIGYKLGFAMGQEKQLLNTPNEMYKSPAIDLGDLTNKLHEDFK